MKNVDELCDSALDERLPSCPTAGLNFAGLDILGGE